MRSILLLKGLNQQLPHVEKFLESRGFNITVVHRLNDAIFSITENRPDFALFSTELIPADSAWLFGVLKQLTSVVLFAERISAKNLSVCQELKGNYILEPPLTPLGFEQMLRRIDRDHKVQAKENPKLNDTHVLIMSALSDLALKALCSPTQPKVQPVQQISRVTCFRVQTSRLAGYFVFAYGENRVFESKWMQEMQAELKKYLNNFDSQISMDPAEEIFIAEVQFPDWSKERAQFLQKAAHNDSELVLAFFKDPAPVSAKPSKKEDYVEVELRHLRGDAVMNYDVYVYLPQNARFVLYTPKGSTLHETQKQKLLSDGIQSVHMHKRSFDELRRQKTKELLEDGVSP